MAKTPKTPNHKKKKQNLSALEKMSLLVEARSLNDEDLGLFLRRKGLHQATLDQWQVQVERGFQPPTKAEQAIQKQAKKRIRLLEKELRRKEKALAETAALLVLSKKWNALFESEEGEN